jgi:hypothetical protein
MNRAAAAWTPVVIRLENEPLVAIRAGLELHGRIKFRLAVPALAAAVLRHNQGAVSTRRALLLEQHYLVVQPFGLLPVLGDPLQDQVAGTEH